MIAQLPVALSQSKGLATRQELCFSMIWPESAVPLMPYYILVSAVHRPTRGPGAFGEATLGRLDRSRKDSGDTLKNTILIFKYKL